MTANAIEAVALSKRFTVPTERRTSFKERVVRGRAPKPREFWALKGATFSVPKGSSLGLIGHNGSGKSTALKVLTGIYRPTSGHVRVDGSVSALLEVGAGFHPELTGRENIRLNATILGFTNREIDRLMDAIIEFADIGDHIDAPIKHYSSGMYVRLGFAVAVMVRPEILLVDEVIAVGDEEFQRKCYDYLYDLRRAGTSMVIVSHGLGQITDLCDEAVWLDGGEVQMVGRPRRVVQGYLDSVNAKEAARTQVSDPVEDEEASTAPDAAASEAPRRLGSGEVRVTAVTVHNSQGAQVPFLVTGEQATFRIAYHATAEVQDGVFGLGFIHESGVFAAGPNSGRIGTWTLHPGQVRLLAGNVLWNKGEKQPSGFIDTVSVEGIGELPVFDKPGQSLSLRTAGIAGWTYPFAEENLRNQILFGPEW
nr:ABC transporter ATP-binding protein [Candidatus Nanopelagicales bacterium]